MVGVIFMGVFDTEVIYYEGECDGAGDMLPQTGRVGYFYCYEAVIQFRLKWQGLNPLTRWDIQVIWE